MEKHLSEKNSLKLVYIGFGLIAIGLVFFLWKEWDNVRYDEVDSAKIGQFGDFIGGVVGSIWALAGFILFYVALNKQKEDLEINRDALKSQIEAMSLQTEEFKAQKEELEETRKIYIEQNKTQNLQRFENTFFNMLSLHHQIVDSIDLDFNDFIDPKSDYERFLDKFNKKLRKGKAIYDSRDVFKTTYLHLHTLIQEDFNQIVKGVTKRPIANIQESYDFFQELNLEKSELEHNNLKFVSHFNSIYNFIYEKVNTDFGHYFRNLYRLIKMIDEQTFDQDSVENDFKKKYYYTSIVRAQLSDYELYWLFFNCLFEYGEKFKPLVEKYAFLKIMDGTSNEVILHYKKFYKDTAFRID
ncbi:hypothetical protein SY27_15460 [Flavobacterium sp. 316]|uniref:putative phage abortive infection protein n=1 Tax=Flavobacterium sp. 316 TaxID=1603293 RepID=UPI0005E684B0|nr:putative phage abortive infection protein [Flavobacterium sp. 316]KIX19925.1 hypothetical protein SY27_15460 [Flavobacterium sp. 316]